jgi:hypothetical protein
MFFHKKPTTPPERQRRVVETPQRNAVFSYHASRSPRQSAAVRSTQQAAPAVRKGPDYARWLKRLPTIAGGLVVLVLLVLSLHLSNQVQIVPIDPNKGQVFLRPLKEYETAAAKAFSGFANSNKLSINTEGIAAQLTTQFPELSTVSVSLPFIGSQPTVYIQPATPRIILSTAGGLFVLDSSGRALITATQVQGLDSLHLPVVTDQSGLDIRLGKVVLPRSTVLFISEIVQQLQAKDLRAVSLTLPAGTNELHVRLDGVGYYTKYNLYGNAREEAGAFLALKQRLERDKKVPKEYIDVRVEGRAYYK